MISVKRRVPWGMLWLLATIPVFGGTPPTPASPLALDPNKPVAQYVHDVWGTQDGLPEASVAAIAFTPDGYMWLGTQEGLARFDGMRFVVFDKTNTPELKSKFITALASSPDGTLWVGTDAGLNRMRQGEVIALQGEEGFFDRSISALYDAPDGSVWIGTEGGGLGRLKDGRLSRYTTREGLSNDFVWSLSAAPDGNLWVGTSKGLNQFAEGKLKVYGARDGLPSEMVRAVRQGGNSVWVGTNRGVCQMREGHCRTYTNPVLRLGVLSIFEDGAGTLWLGTDGGGLKRIEGPEVSSLTAKDGLSDDRITTVAADAAGSLWLGTYGGLTRLRDGDFTSYGPAAGLAGQVVPILQSRDGSMWIGDTRGLNQLRGGKVVAHYSTEQGLPGDTVLSLLETADGSIWTGTPAGLAQINDGRVVKTYTTRSGLPNDRANALLESRDGSLWIGTQSGGLAKLQAGRFTVYTTREGLPSDVIRALYQDPTGTLWIGTEGGLAELSSGKLVAYTARDGLAGNEVSSIYQDQQGALWIGSFNFGLTRLKDGKFTVYTTRDGLFDPTVFAILEDDTGYLWMSCNRGVYRVRREELNDFAEGKTQAIHCIPYAEVDGMASRECNGGFQPAGWKARDGTLWFPTVKGAVAVDPTHLSRDQEPPRVILEQVLVDGRMLPIRAPINAPPGRGNLELRYTGLSLSAPSRLRFWYQLEGFDKAAVEAGSRRVAYYTNISPGHYRFHVSACNRDGFCNEVGTSIEVVLKPHFHQTWAFYVPAHILIIGCARGRVQDSRPTAQYAQARAGESRAGADQGSRTGNRGTQADRGCAEQDEPGAENP